MTILNGEQYVVETFAHFEERLNVTGGELHEALSDDDIEAIQREDDLDVEVIPPEVIRDYIDAMWGTNEAIITILENREGDYIHLYDGIVNTIVEVHG